MNLGAEYGGKKYSIEAYFKNYKKFIDRKGQSWEDYIKRLDNLERRIGKINFNTNAIIYCNRPIFKDVCLIAAKSVPELKTAEYMGACDLYDIFDGNRCQDNSRVHEDDVYYSGGDIKTGIAAIHAGLDGKPGWGPMLVYQSAIRRRDRVKGSITWIFIYGDRKTLDESYFGFLRRLVVDENLKKIFKEIDLNPLLGKPIKIGTTIATTGGETSEGLIKNSSTKFEFGL